MRNGAYKIKDIEDLEKLRFNVNEVPMAYYPNGWIGGNEQIGGLLTNTKDYKCLVTDEGKLLSVVGKNYKLVRNSELIDALFDRLKETGFEYNLSDQDSYYTDKRMRLHFTFPELRLKDENSDIPLSLWVHNSYNGTEGIRIQWGAMRLVCGNGMVIGTLLKQFYHKHSKGFYLPNMERQFDEAFRAIPEINSRIKLLENETFTEEDHKKIDEIFGDKFLSKAFEGYPEERMKLQSKWFVINLLTYYISHTISLQQRQIYQNKLTKITGI